MSLKTKVVQLVVSSFLVYVTVDYAIQRLVVFPSFVALEREEALQDMHRCREALHREVEHLSQFTHDWSPWDDTHRFVQDHNAEYSRANSAVGLFEEREFNPLYCLDQDGKVVWGEMRDQDDATVLQLEEFPAESFPSDHLLLRQGSPEKLLDGFLSAHSAGPGQGATFRLALPLEHAEVRS